MVSLPLPPSSLSCFLVPWIGVVWLWLWMTNLPLILGQPLWLTLAIAVGTASTARTARSGTRRMRMRTTYLGSGAEQVGQDCADQRPDEQPGAHGEKPRLPDGLLVGRMGAVRPCPQRATGDPRGAADAKHRVSNPVTGRLVHDTGP